MYKRILVPLDGSELAECVFPHVEAITNGCGVGEVIFIRVVEPFYLHAAALDEGVSIRDKDLQEIDAINQKAARDYFSELKSRIKYSSANVKTEVTVGKAAESIAEYATKNEVDLIVIATHGRSGVSRWIWGSVADRILRSACVPVLMVRPQGCTPAI